MSRFTSFLIEKTITPINLRDVANTLLDNCTLSYIDTILEYLVSVEDKFIGFTQKPSKGKFTLPGKSIIFGKDPTTRNWFVGYNLKNPCYSNKDILDSYGGGSADILKTCLRVLPDLHIGGVLELKVLYIKPDVSVSKENLTYTSPDGIKHVIPAQSKAFEPIKNSQIGIEVLGKFEGRDIKSLQRVPDFIPNIKPTRLIWIAPKSIQDHSGLVSFTASESEFFKKLITELIEKRKKLSNQFLNQGKLLGLFSSMKKYNSNVGTVSTSSPNVYITGLADWIKNHLVTKLNNDNKKQIKLKAEDLIGFLNRNQTMYKDFLKFYFDLIELDKILGAKLDYISKLDTDDLIVTDNSNGYVKFFHKSGF